MAKLRHEINIIDTTLQTSGVNSTSGTNNGGVIQLDTTQHNGTVSYYFEIVAKNGTGGSVSVTLRRAGTTTDDSTISVPSTQTTYTRNRSTAFTPPTGQTEYFVQFSSSSTMFVQAARIIILQDTSTDSLTLCETQIEIGNKEIAFSGSTSLRTLANPKYWYYDSSKWDGTVTFYAEATYKVSGTGTITIKLQEDDGSFGTWSDKVTIINAGAATGATRGRSASFTPTTGRNYRVVGTASSTMANWDIYNGKIIVDQVAPTSVVGSYKFDSSAGAVTDPNNAWTNEANVFDTDVTPSTYGVADFAGSTGAGYIYGKGTAAPTTGSTIASVEVRIYGKMNGGGTETVTATVYTSGLGAQLGTVSTTANGWSGYVTLSTPSGGWDWNKVSLLEAKVYAVNITAGVTGAYAVEVRVNTFSGGITLLESQYLLLNQAASATGLQDFDTYFDPAVWDTTNVYYHEQNASLNTSNTKLQQDPNGTPADITNSSVTGGSATATDSRKRSASALTMPGTAQTIDANVISA